jgi:hypothetical protein
MCPVSRSDGHDAPWLFGELVPAFAAMGDDILVAFEDAVGQPVVAHELPDIFDRVQFRRAWRQRDDCDVVGDRELGGSVPSSLVKDQDGVGTGIDLAADGGEVLGHRMGVAVGHDDPGTFAFGRAYGTENIRPFRALIMRCPGACSAPRPTPRDLVLLSNARFILKPDFYRPSAASAADIGNDSGEVFLNASMASSSCA